MPTDFCDQLYETRRVLAWLAGSSDEIPVDDDNRGRLMGARDNYARTDPNIRRVHACPQRDLARHEATDRTAASGEIGHAQSHQNRPDVAWLQGVRDLLGWVLGGCPTAPLSGRVISLLFTHITMNWLCRPLTRHD